MTLVDCAAYNAWHGGTVVVGVDEIADGMFDLLLALLWRVPAFASYSKRRLGTRVSSLGNGIQWDTCQPASMIAVSVSFIQSCTFSMSIFGKAVV